MPTNEIGVEEPNDGVMGKRFNGCMWLSFF